LTPSGQRVDAEVVGFSGDRLFLMPSTDVYGLEPGALVVPVDPAAPFVPSPGRRLHPRRRAEDRAKQVGSAGPCSVAWSTAPGVRSTIAVRSPSTARCRCTAGRSNPLDRAPIRTVLDVGVRAINALLTVGRGQRLGLFAGSGVGKSVLLGMMARYTRPMWSWSG
jgi:flagellum-specific ATP synthase